MTPLVAEKEPAREVKKRYPAPPCPGCKSDNTIVLSTLDTLRKYRCLNCGRYWEGCRKK